MSVKANRDYGSYYYTRSTTRLVPRRRGVVNARACSTRASRRRDVGNEGNYACTSVRRAINLGMIPAPRCSMPAHHAPYGGQFTSPTSRTWLSRILLRRHARRDAQAIRQNIHYGVRLIKIVVDDQRYIYSTDDIRFIIQEAEKAGLKVAAHAWTHKGAHNAAEAGVASIEHGFDMTDEDLELAKKNKVVLVGTEYLALRSKAARPKWVDRLRRDYRIGSRWPTGQTS